MSEGTSEPVPTDLRASRNSSRPMQAAATAADGQRVVAVLRTSNRNDVVGAYVLTDRLLIEVVGGEDPVANTWRLSALEAVSLRKFEPNGTDSEAHLAGFESLQVRFAGDEDPLTIPPEDMTVSSEERDVFISGLWSVWTS